MAWDTLYNLQFLDEINLQKIIHWQSVNMSSWWSHQVYNSTAELDLASKFPHVRIFQAALETSMVELRDLSGVSVPWSVPKTSKVAGVSPACVVCVSLFVCLNACVCEFMHTVEHCIYFQKLI